MMALSLYILVDSIFIGQGVGVDGLTALNISLPIFSMFICLGIFLGMGGATAFSVSIGRDDLREAQEIFTITIIFAGILSTLFTVLSVVYIDELCRFLGASERLFDMVKGYSIILVAFAPAFIFNSVLSIFCRNDHAPKLSMIAGISGNIVNIILDYIFIFIFHWGMIGAIIATIINPVISVSILLFHFRNKNNRLRLVCPHNIREKIKRICKNGFPSFLDSIAPGIIVYSFNHVLLKLSGDLGVASYSIIANIAFVGNAFFIGTSEAIQPIIGQNYGADNHSRVKKVFKLGLVTALLIGLVKLSIIWIFPDQIIHLFNSDDSTLIATARLGLKLFFLALPFSAINVIMIGLFQAIEKARIATLLMFSRTVILIIAGLMFMPAFWGLQGVWMIVPMAEFVTSIICLIVYHKTLKLRLKA